MNLDLSELFGLCSNTNSNPINGSSHVFTAFKNGNSISSVPGGAGWLLHVSGASDKINSIADRINK